MIYIVLLAILFLTSTVVLICDRSEPWAWTLFGPAALILIVLPSIRYHIGWDWEAYEYMLEQAAWDKLGGVSGDWLFDVLLNVLQQPVGLNTFCAVTIVCGFLFFIRRANPSISVAALALPLFLWYGYYSAWSTMRQGLAIVLVSHAFLSRFRLSLLLMILASLIHKSALLPFGIWLAWNAATRFGFVRRALIPALLVAALGAIYELSRLDVLEVAAEFVLPMLGQERALAFGSREFFLDPYPLITGRMAELCLSLVVMFAFIAKTPPGDKHRILIVKRLAELQGFHLATYLACSPLTFLAERMVLFFDFVHCAAVATAIGIGIGWFVSDRGTGVRHRAHQGQAFYFTSMLLAMTFLFAYISNRYVSVFSLGAREAGEMSHYERFFPYQTLL